MRFCNFKFDGFVEFRFASKESSFRFLEFKFAFLRIQVYVFENSSMRFVEFKFASKESSFRFLESKFSFLRIQVCGFENSSLHRKN